MNDGSPATRSARFAAILIFLLSAGALLEAHAQCTATVDRTVNICSPAPGSNNTSPVQFTAAALDNEHVVTAMNLYVDSVKSAQSSSAQLSASLALASGTHNIVIRAWDSSGFFFSSSESITVSTTTGGVSISISPTSAMLAPKGTQQFTATVSGASDTSATWSVDGVAGGNSTTGTISTSGFYTAPAAAGNHQVTATSNADSSKSASASVTVSSGGGGPCAATADRTVNICSPAAGSSNTSPVQFTAAALDNEFPVTAMIMYVDSVKSAQSSSALLSASLSLASGTHNIVIRAWDTSGFFFSSSESIAVGSGTGTVSISISPTSATLAPNATQQFTATVSGSTNTSATWSVDGVVGGNTTTGTISTSGLYTAPAAAGNHQVTATSNADSTKSASAAVTVNTAAGVSISVSPTSTTLAPNATQQFTATVTGSTNTSATWSVDGVASGNSTTGTISTSGLYTAPAAAGNHQVTATSNADSTKSASASVKVNGGGCAATTDRIVNICSPAPGSSNASPVQFTAAALDNEHPVTAMILYVDSVKSAQSSNAQLSASLSLASGTHSIVIRAWDTSGFFFSSSESITVGSSTGAVSISISPTSATLAPNATQQFTASVTGSTNTSATWSVDGVVGGNATTGTISTSGLYTAPAAAGNHQVTATSNADSTKSASASVTVSGGSTCSAPAGGEAICKPAPNATVTSPFEVQGASNLSPAATTTLIYLDNVLQFTQSGPSVDTTITAAAGNHFLVVQSYNGAWVKASENITVSTTAGVTVSINPTSATLAPSAAQQFTATVQNASDTTVVWTVDGVTGGNSSTGTISTSGLYTAPSVTGNHVVTATSNADSTKSASANVSVSNGTPPGGVSVLTSKNDNARTGANTSETQLDPTTVASSQFHKLGSWSLDASMQAQPLYVPGVTINGATFNVLYVATENDTVYALNADVPGSAPLWQRSLIPAGATIGTGYTGGRTSIGANVGVTGTPVIDPSTNRLYVIGRTTENSTNVYRVHALDIRTGAEVTPNIVVHASVPGTGDGSSGGTLTFDGNTQNQRPGLLLVNGVVYAGFASFGDQTPYNGWVIGFDANTLQVVSQFATTPNGDGAGIWMAGTGLSADASGAIYFTSGNGMPNATALFNPTSDLPQTVFKLSGSLTLMDFFAPFNEKCLSADDLDLGSSGVLVLPDGVTGQNMAVVGSKEGRIYLLDRGNLGQFNSSDQVIQEILINPAGPCGSSTFDASSPWRMYGSPSYWNGNVYTASAFGPLRQYSISSGKLAQVAVGSVTYTASGQNGRGPIPVISANGTGGGVVWTSWRDLNGNGWLHAYDANNVSNLLFTSEYGPGTVFTVPTVANGRVYVTGSKVVYAYGTH